MAQNKPNGTANWQLRCCSGQPACTGLPPLSTTICCRRSAIFGHLARLGDEVPAHKALNSCVRLSQGRLPDPTWKRRRGRPRGRWLDQLWRDNNRPPADQWKLAIKRGHGGRVTLRSHDYATTWPDLSGQPSPQNTSWHSTASAESNSSINAQRINLHSFMPSLHWTDTISNMSPLWKWRENSWTPATFPPKLGSRTATVLWWLNQHTRCVPGWWQPGGIPHLFGASAPPPPYRQCLTGSLRQWQQQQ